MNVFVYALFHLYVFSVIISDQDCTGPFSQKLIENGCTWTYTLVSIHRTNSSLGLGKWSPSCQAELLEPENIGDSGNIVQWNINIHDFMIGIVSPVPTQIMLPKWQLCWLNTTERKERKKKALIENIPLSSAVSTTPRQHVKLMTLAGLRVCYLIWMTDDASQCSLLTSRNTLMLKASPAQPRGSGMQSGVHAWI